MDDGMDELLGEFLVESFENLDQLDQDLVVLEHDPNDREVLKSIFRTIHTVKGTCGFLGFSKLEAVTHVGENLLSLLRDGVADVDRPIADALMNLTDAVREMLTTIEATQAEGDTDYSELITTLEDLVVRANSPAQADQDIVNDFIADAEPFSQPDLSMIETPPGARVGEILVQQGAVSEVEVALGLLRQEAGDERLIGEILTEEAGVTPAAVAVAMETQKVVKSLVADATLRVDVNVLDKLMQLVGELVLTRNQLLQVASTVVSSDPAFVSTTQRLNSITTELQNGVMKTRMQPIGNVWAKFPRLARDVAASCEKQVRVEMEGKDTELDKTIIEAIKDPLTHVIRNSIDHGIETPAVRTERGKPVEGVVKLRAFHEGGQVIIEIIDDGGGIDVERVKAKALEKGLVDAAVLETMSDRDATNLVFLPGFSTAAAVSNISGRGVGMDVVKTNIERIGGAVDLQSTPGEGSTLRIKIPLTLAIVPALIATLGRDHFAIPQVSVNELVGIDAESFEREVEDVHGAPVYRLRGRILPLLNLREQLGLEPAASKAATIVVLKADDQEFGLLVDAVSDTEEIVVKPLSPLLEHLTAFSGCTIMGDGRVALILDVPGIARTGRITLDVTGTTAANNDVRTTTSLTDRYLIAQVGGGNRIALSLRLVDRLEEFPTETLECALGQEVVQYRGMILSLVDLGMTLGFGPNERRDTTHAVVCSIEGHLIGLVVETIVDIVHDSIVPEGQSHHPGMLGSAVVQGAVTDVIDVRSTILYADPSFLDQPADAGQEASYV